MSLEQTTEAAIEFTKLLMYLNRKVGEFKLTG